MVFSIWKNKKEQDLSQCSLDTPKGVCVWEEHPNENQNIIILEDDVPHV